MMMALLRILLPLAISYAITLITLDDIRYYIIAMVVVTPLHMLAGAAATLRAIITPPLLHER